MFDQDGHKIVSLPYVMKSVARSYMWWPGLDKAIEEVVKSCTSCKAVKHSPAVAPVQPWTWPNQP